VRQQLDTRGVSQVQTETDEAERGSASMEIVLVVSVPTFNSARTEISEQVKAGKVECFCTAKMLKYLTVGP
jgi:hypothetical protein